MRVADKRVTATKNVPFGTILTVCMILLVCDGCRLGQQEPEGGLTNLQLFSQAPIFTFAETQQPNQRKRGVSAPSQETSGGIKQPLRERAEPMRC